MINSSSKIADINTFIHLGEYDPNGVIGKLYDLDVYIDSHLSHNIHCRRGIEIYFSRYVFEKLVKDVINKIYYPKITFSHFRTLGQGMYGYIAYCSGDMTIKEVIKFLEAFHLRLTLTKHK